MQVDASSRDNSFLNTDRFFGSGLTKFAKLTVKGGMRGAAEGADLISKATLSAGLLSSGVLIADSIAYSLDKSFFTARCGIKVPLLFLNHMDYRDSICFRPGKDSAQLNTLNSFQVLIALGILFVATPVVSIGARKVSQLARELSDYIKA